MAKVEDYYAEYGYPQYGTLNSEFNRINGVKSDGKILDKANNLVVQSAFKSMHEVAENLKPSEEEIDARERREKELRKKMDEIDELEQTLIEKEAKLRAVEEFSHRVKVFLDEVILNTDEYV